MTERCFNCGDADRCGIFAQNKKDNGVEKAWDGWCVDYVRDEKLFKDESDKNDKEIFADLVKIFYDKGILKDELKKLGFKVKKIK